MAANLKLLEDAVYHTECDPEVRLNLVRQSGFMLYEYVGGSHCYGTNLPTSDRDVRSIFCLPMSHYLSIKAPIEQISDQRETEEKKKNDDIAYTLHRFFDLLKVAAPNVIESLWVPEDCVVSSSPEFQEVIANRDIFISKECITRHCGYAMGQFKRADSTTRKSNHPEPVERPKKLDFCRIIPCVPGAEAWTHPDMPSPRMPFRPIPIKDMPWINLADYHVAAVEHMQNAYRLYCYFGDPQCKGVFRGDDMLVCESIPIDDEHTRFSGILLYDEHEYERAVKLWQSYWTWFRERNQERYAGHEDGKRHFNAKNMAHCMRLLLSGLHLAKYGEPMVRLSGKPLEQVMDIRTGKTSDYERLVSMAEEKMMELREVEKSCKLSEKIDLEKVEALYRKVSEMAWNRLL